MARFFSPPPTISSFQEPAPSSDEDLVPNEPSIFNPPQRKRKPSKPGAAQPSSKRQKLAVNEKLIPPRSQPLNAVAGPSKPRRRPKSPSTLVAPPSNGIASRSLQPGSNSQVGKGSSSKTVPKLRTQGTSGSSTRPVKRTKTEKRRQHGSESDSDPSTFPDNPAPSASAPVPKRRDSEAFTRSSLGKRFTTKSETAPVRPKKPMKTADVIDICDSSEDERRMNPRPAPKLSIQPGEIIVVTDSESDSRILRKPTARKARKHNGVKPAPLASQQCIEISDSDDEPTQPVPKPKAKLEDPESDAHQMPTSIGSRVVSPDPMNLDADLGGVGELSASPDPDPPKDFDFVQPPAYGSGSSRATPSHSPAAASPIDTDSRPGGAPEYPPAQNGGRGPPTPLDDQRSVSVLEEGNAPHVPVPVRSPPENPKSPDAMSPLSEASVPKLTGTTPGERSPSPMRVSDASEEPAALSRPSTPSRDSGGATGSSVHTSVHLSPPVPSPPSSPPPLFRPNGLLRSRVRDSTPQPAPLFMTPSQRMAKAPRPSVSTTKDTPSPSSSKASPQSSPYKGIRDRAVGTAAATLQHNLGLPPRLDLRSLRKKRLSYVSTPPLPRSESVDMPEAELQTHGQNAGLDEYAFPASPSLPKKNGQSLMPEPKPLIWKQSSLVEAIIATGQHNERLNHSVSPQPPPPPYRLPLPPSPHPPSTPPALDERTPLTPPPLKVEEAPSGGGPNNSLIDDIIDLTLSDNELDPPPRPSAPVLNPTHQKYKARIANIMKRTRSTALQPSPDAQSPSCAKVGEHIPALGDVPLQNEAGWPPARGSSTTLPPPSAESTTMDVDADDGIPPQSVVSKPPHLPPDLVEAPQEMPTSAAEIAPTQRPQTPIPQDDKTTPSRRQSYDDTELDEGQDLGAVSSVTDGLPGDIVTGSELENLIAPISMVHQLADMNVEPDETRGLASASLSPAPLPNLDIESEHTSDDGEDSVPAPFQKPVAEATDLSIKDSQVSSDDESSVSSPPPLRRSSRRSSKSRSTDPLDGYEVESYGYTTPMSPLSNGHRDMRAISPPSFESMNESLYPVMTWDSYRRDLRNFQFPVYYAKDLASSLHDYINASDEYFRGSLHMRQVFESTILENTAEDEPDAPPIEVVNDVDAEPSPPWEFYYTNKIWLGEGIDPPDVTQLVGCDCKGKCDPKSTTCACLLRQKPFVETVWAPGFAYDHKGRLRTPGAPIFECNAMCACDDDECKNRVVQHGRKVSVSIKKTPKKGWGVFATKRIAKGSFIGVYSGEFLKDDVCERRGLVYDKSGRTYLLDIDFYHLGETKYVVDAYHAGNFTRFLNNSCNPNCQVVPCYINEPDIEKPLMTLFAKRDIAVAEELCFSYQGYDPDTAEPGDAAIMANNSITNKCFCGAPNCTGFMFG